MNKITVIIPFLNEGEEIEKTVKSIRETAGDSVSILLVNDNSTDGYNYLSVALKYNTYYLLNKDRQGVAKSRDIGVNFINTPYFILFDGHMRCYDNNWWETYEECLDKNDRAIYCCKCIALNEDGKPMNEFGYGAQIHFLGDQFSKVLEPEWITKEPNTCENLNEVPCVLGASYSTSKSYWNKLKGLEGLRYYGCDEVYLSIKARLEGGQCFLLKDIGIGHIFRSKHPYFVTTIDMVYNKLLIAETIFPDDLVNKVHDKLKALCPFEYYPAKQLLKKNQEFIKELRKYYSGILKKSLLKNIISNEH